MSEHGWHTLSNVVVDERHVLAGEVKLTTVSVESLLKVLLYSFAVLKRPVDIFIVKRPKAMHKLVLH